MVKELFTLIRRYPIQLEYIEAHTSKEDIHSYGNDKADKLANNSIGLIKCDKKYLEIPFKNKDEAKINFLSFESDVSKAMSKGVFKKNTASRLVSRLSKKVKNLK